MKTWHSPRRIDIIMSKWKKMVTEQPFRILKKLKERNTITSHSNKLAGPNSIAFQPTTIDKDYITKLAAPFHP